VSDSPRADRLAHLDGPVTYELAGWSVRAWAFMIDLVPLLVLLTAVTAGAVLLEEDADDARALASVLGWGLGLPLLLLWNALPMARKGARNGQTFGKQLMGIRVVRESGELIGYGSAFLREGVGRLLLLWPTGGLYALVDCSWPLWDGGRQCLHDKVSETRVVLIEPVQRGHWPPPAEPLGATAADAPGAPRAPEPAAAPQPTSGGSAVAPPPPAGDRPVRGGWLPPAADR
jgi:uncharacterized RDD family membrane protein YckC